MTTMTTTTMSLLNYKRQATQPTWFNENESHFYHSVTSGSSPSNEWYEFETEDTALAFTVSFESQSVIDHFTLAPTEDGPERYFETEDIADLGDFDLPASAKEGATPASFAELAQAESRF